MSGWGAFIGLLYAFGIVSIMQYRGPWRALRLHRRVQAVLHPTQPSFLAPSLRLLGSSRQARIEQRQREAGQPANASVHVLRSLTGAVIGLAVATAILAVLSVAQQVRNPTGALLLLAVGAGSGWLVIDHRLGQRVRLRQQQAQVTLPAFAEAIAMAVAAGASLPTAIRIVGERSDGVIAEGLRATTVRIDGGAGLETGLRELATLFPSASMHRLVDAMLIALERGTPIAEVLHAQAVDARQESRRLLLETAGRREVAMLIPVIFFVLPAVVVVALYPGFRELASIAT